MERDVHHRLMAHQNLRMDLQHMHQLRRQQLGRQAIRQLPHPQRYAQLRSGMKEALHCIREYARRDDHVDRYEGVLVEGDNIRYRLCLIYLIL